MIGTGARRPIEHSSTRSRCAATGPTGHAAARPPRSPARARNPTAGDHDDRGSTRAGNRMVPDLTAAVTAITTTGARHRRDVHTTPASGRTQGADRHGSAHSLGTPVSGAPADEEAASSDGAARCAGAGGQASPRIQGGCSLEPAPPKEPWHGEYAPAGYFADHVNRPRPHRRPPHDTPATPLVRLAEGPRRAPRQAARSARADCGRMDGADGTPVLHRRSHRPGRNAAPASPQGPRAGCRPPGSRRADGALGHGSEAAQWRKIASPHSNGSTRRSRAARTSLASLSRIGVRTGLLWPGNGTARLPQGPRAGCRPGAAPRRRGASPRV